MWRAVTAVDQVLSNTDRHSEALRVAQEAENLFATSGDKSGQAQANVMISYLHDAFSERDDAIVSANRAVELARECADETVEDQAREALEKVERKPVVVQEAVQQPVPQLTTGAPDVSESPAPSALQVRERLGQETRKRQELQSFPHLQCRRGAH